MVPDELDAEVEAAVVDAVEGVLASRGLLGRRVHNEAVVYEGAEIVAAIVCQILAARGRALWSGGSRSVTLDFAGPG